MSFYLRLMAFAFVATLCSNNLYADEHQSSHSTTLKELFQLADTANVSIKSSEIALSVADATIAEATTSRLPDISSQLSISYLGDGYLWDRDFKNGANINMPHFGNNFVLKVSQAIYTGGATSSQINLSRFGKEMAKNNLELTKSNIRFMLVGYYLQLSMLQNQVHVYDANIALTQRMIAQMKSRFTEGVSLKNDITRYELQFENQKLQRIRLIDQASIINHRIITALHLPSNVRIMPDTTIISTLPDKYDILQWQNMAKLGSLTIKQSELTIKMSQEKIKLEKSAQLPKIALFAEEHLDGPITIEVPALNNNFNYWYVGIGISYNISSLFKADKSIKRAQFSANQARQEHNLALEKVENDINEAYTNYTTSFSELDTQLKSVELANQNYKVVSTQYSNGMVLISELTDASYLKLEAELALINSRINILFHYYNMLYLTNSL